MNKRPLLCVLAGFVLGEVWMRQFRSTTALAVLCLGGILFVGVRFIRKSSLFLSLFLVCGIVFGGIRQMNWNTFTDNFNELYGTTINLCEGQIEEIVKTETSYSFILKNVWYNGKFYGGKMQIYPEEQAEYPIGCIVSVKGCLDDFQTPTNPGQFNQKTYKNGKGILGVIYDATITKVRYGSFLIWDGILEFRDCCLNYLSANLKEENVGPAKAMAFGDKESLSEKEKELYETGGISHVLAVSGLHMSLLGAGLYKILRRLGLGYGFSVCGSFPCIMIYAVMTGMSSSCVRAAIMLIVYLIAEWRGLYYDLPSSLSLAGILLLYEIPERITDSGFLLSFGALISVGIAGPFLYELFEYQTGRNFLKDQWLSGLVIQIFTLPLSLYFFYAVSAAGILLNLIVIPLMSLLVPLLFASGIGWLPFFPKIWTAVCLYPAELILNLYRFLCNMAGKSSVSYLQLGYRGTGFALVYYGVLAFGILLCYLVKNKNRAVRFVCLGFTIFSIVLVIGMSGRNGTFLTFLDVGQGDGMIYQDSKGCVCMIDGGSTTKKEIGRYIIKPALEYYGIKSVKYWFISHMDEDHVSGLVELLEAGYEIESIILPYRENKSEKQIQIETLADINKTEILYMKQGEMLSLSEGIFFCLHPSSELSYEDENQSSLVLLLKVKNQRILLTGDVEKEGEEQMASYLNLYLSFNEKEKNSQYILKAAHHGSANGTSEDFLKIFRPDLAIISCGLHNSYGHPADSVIERLKNSNTGILYTMKQGAIELVPGEKAKYYSYAFD